MERLAAEIRNAAWWVRHYARGRTSAIHRTERQVAIRRLGLIVRQAFGASDDFESILTAILDGLSTRDNQRF